MVSSVNQSAGIGHNGRQRAREGLMVARHACPHHPVNIGSDSTRIGKLIVVRIVVQGAAKQRYRRLDRQVVTGTGLFGLTGEVRDRDAEGTGQFDQKGPLRDRTFPALDHGHVGMADAHSIREFMLRHAGDVPPARDA